MALLKPTLITEIELAFKAPLWATAANLFTNAIDNFVNSGTPKTVVNAIVYPPLPATPYPIIDNAEGIITTTQKAALLTAVQTAFISPLWATVGPIIASAISALVNTAVITMTLAPPISSVLVGTGAGSATTTTDAELLSILTTAFTLSVAWETTVLQIADAVYSLVISAIVNTTDSGVVPPVTWSGAGIGSIT